MHLFMTLQCSTTHRMKDWWHYIVVQQNSHCATILHLKSIQLNWGVNKTCTLPCQGLMWWVHIPVTSLGYEQLPETPLAAVNPAQDTLSGVARTGESAVCIHTVFKPHCCQSKESYFPSACPLGKKRQTYHTGTMISLLEMSLQPLSPPQTGMCLSSFWSGSFFFSDSPWGRHLIRFSKHYLWIQNTENVSLQIVCTICPKLSCLAPKYVGLQFSDFFGFLLQTRFTDSRLFLHVQSTETTDLYLFDLHGSISIACNSCWFLLRPWVQYFVLEKKRYRSLLALSTLITWQGTLGCHRGVRSPIVDHLLPNKHHTLLLDVSIGPCGYSAYVANTEVKKRVRFIQERQL